jgi:hypothetical protein
MVGLGVDTRKIDVAAVVTRTIGLILEWYRTSGSAVSRLDAGSAYRRRHHNKKQCNNDDKEPYRLISTSNVSSTNDASNFRARRSPTDFPVARPPPGAFELLAFDARGLALDRGLVAAILASLGPG